MAKFQNLSNSTKPFVKWVGGKTQLISSIENALPQNFADINDLTYIEPFVGGGSVMFWMLSKYKNIRRAIINDINKDLTLAYQTVRDDVHELIRSLSEIQNIYLDIREEEKRREFYLKQRDLFNQKNMTDIENTTLFIFLNRTCFNGLYRVNSKGKFNVPFGKYAKPTICDEKTLLADSELLQRVEILTGDFTQTINYTSNNTFFYFDPPYKPLSNTSSFTSYAKDDFNDADQIRLKKFCDTLNNHGYGWLLSNSDVKSNNPDNDFFDSLYSDYQINRVWASRNINANPDKRGKLTELLITNHSLDQLEYVRAI